MKFPARLKWGIGFVCLASIGLVVATNGAAIAESGKVTQSVEWQPIPADGRITKPGRYQLKQDLQVDRATGIKIEADDVTLDLCGHAVRYTGAPKEGTYGITATNSRGITIANGIVGGFWFNVHCSQDERLRIHDLKFDNIPYIGVNAADSKDVVIADSVFENFRYDLKKDKNNTYVIGINIGADGAVIANNRFDAQVKQGTGKDVGVETVFVLFSAQVTKNSLVTRNKMEANEVLTRSYGVWVATNAQVSVVNNSIQNVKYGVCVASDAESLICFNRFTATPGASVETIGISATGAKEVLELRNTFVGLTTPAALPPGKNVKSASGG